MAETHYRSVLSDEATLSDDLGRRGFVETLTKVMLEAETPLVVALYGPWGSGKTSMMRQLQESLKESSDKSSPVATVWFVPWEHSKDDQPGVSLLLAIRRDLGLEKIRDVNRTLKAIALAITDEVRLPYIGLSLGRIRGNYQQLAKQDVERRSEQSLLRQHFETIVSIARGGDNSQKKLVIFIDDLDRCQPATAVAVLEALKLYLNLEGCIFVLGIDRGPIEAAIANEYENLGIAKESYLDKIVQLPFTIPSLGKMYVDEYVATRLPGHLKDCQQMLVLAAPDNPRQLKRTINTLLLLDRIAETSLPRRDNRILCAVALIQNSAPDLYQHLRRIPDDWALVVPAGIESQERSARPSWLEKMLGGSDAREALSAALFLLRGILGSSSTGVVNIQPYIGLSEQIAGRSPGAEPVEATEQQTAAGRPESPEQADQDAAARIEEAIPLYERALADRERELGPRHAETLTAQRNLANAYQAAGRTNQAIALYERILGSLTETSGKDDPDTLAAQSNLASVYQAAGRIEQAIALNEQALEGMTRALGPDHPNVLTARSNLGNAYQAAGQSAAAITQYEQAIEGMTRVLGRNHPDVLTAQANLANAYQAAGQSDQATRLNEQTLEAMTLILGPDHPSTQAVRAQLMSPT